ncbi:hypothetical protein L2734_05825 [Parashewanella spongiae]|nr:hypothetical protein [Parashewanella spongiae]MCL1077697.1 hypothetical protein [Parashewanella spongiae]
MVHLINLLKKSEDNENNIDMLLSFAKLIESEFILNKHSHQDIYRLAQSSFHPFSVDTAKCIFDSSGISKQLLFTRFMLAKCLFKLKLLNSINFIFYNYTKSLDIDLIFFSTKLTHHQLLIFFDGYAEKFIQAHLTGNQEKLTQKLNSLKLNDECILHLNTYREKILFPQLLGNLPIIQPECVPIASIEHRLPPYDQFERISFRLLVSMVYEQSLSERVDDSELNLDEITFGEEHEYSVKEKHLKNEATRRAYLDELETTFQKQLKKEKIAHSSQSIDYSEKKSFKLGDWEFAFFFDGHFLEFHTKPYKFRQQFCIEQDGEEKLLETSQLVKKIITPLVESEQLTGVSGHKHMDTYNVLAKNPELSLRLLADIEESTWLPVVLKRVEDMMFFFFAKGDKKEFSELKKLVAKLNEKILNKDQRKSLNYKEFVKFVRLLKIYSSFGMKNIPLNLQHIDDAEHSIDMNVKPSSTVEFRFFHCPRNAEEIDADTQYILGRLKFLHQQQQLHEPIRYSPLDTKAYTAESAEKEAAIKAAQAKLTYEQFKKFMRIDATEVSKQYFEHVSQPSFA